MSESTQGTVFIGVVAALWLMFLLALAAPEREALTFFEGKIERVYEYGGKKQFAGVVIDGRSYGGPASLTGYLSAGDKVRIGVVDFESREFNKKIWALSKNGKNLVAYEDEVSLWGYPRMISIVVASVLLAYSIVILVLERRVSGAKT